MQYFVNQGNPLFSKTLICVDEDLAIIEDTKSQAVSFFAKALLEIDPPNLSVDDHPIGDLHDPAGYNRISSAGIL